MDGQTDRRTYPQLTVIDLNWSVLTIFDEVTNKHESLSKIPLVVDTKTDAAAAAAAMEPAAASIASYYSERDIW